MIYKKKPVEVEAVQWNGYNISEIEKFVGKSCKIEYHESQCSEYCSVTSAELVIHTLEGNMHASVNDYIIKGVKGEFYPCKPDIFNQTYEKANTHPRKGLVDIEKACDWLKENARNYASTAAYSTVVNYDEEFLVEDFKKYMEGKDDGTQTKFMGSYTTTTKTDNGKKYKDYRKDK